MPDSRMSSDRIEKYLRKLNKGIIFDELSDDYLERAGIRDILKGIPVPITAGASDELSAYSIALVMARVIGSDTKFKYKNEYLEYINRLFGADFILHIISEGAKAGGAGDYELACAFFRAALAINPRSQAALYLYGRACKDAYEIETDDEEYVGRFKAESLEIFEILTMLHKDFPMGYYFLGYAYANLGLYKKAELTWHEFMMLTENTAHNYKEKNEGLRDTGIAGVTGKELTDLREEIKERLNALQEPVKIESGVNAVLSGSFTEGKKILSVYKEGTYSKWWPLWYYLGVSEAALGNHEVAVRNFKTALGYTPANTEIMQRLVELYEAAGDTENAEKYSKKIKIVKYNAAKENI